MSGQRWASRAPGIVTAGRVFGSLTILADARRDARNFVTAWTCRCACGRRCTVSRAKLLRRFDLSCGCQAPGRAIKTVKGWSDEELAQVVAWRAQINPPTFTEIGRRLGRSEQSVRLKLYDEHRKADRQGTPPPGFTHDQRKTLIAAPICHHPAFQLCDAVLASGGMSARILVDIPNGGGGRSLLLIAPNGAPRPTGWRDGMPWSEMNADQRAHLVEVRAWWANERIVLEQAESRAEARDEAA